MRTGKRGKWVGLAVVLALALMAFFAWTATSTPPVATGMPPSPESSRDTSPHWAEPPPTGDARITGTLREDKSPVLGARAFASRSVSGRVLAEVMPCISREATPRAEAAASADDPPCWALDPEELREQVDLYARAARTLAESTTGANGAFSLEGLAKGKVTLWALGDMGAALLPEVEVGTEGVSLPLEAGVTFRGQVVRVTDEQPIPNARIILLGHTQLLFFEAKTDAEGRYTFGPLPRTDYAAVVMGDGWGSQFFRSVDLMPERVELGQTTRFTGRVVTPGGAAVAGALVELSWDDHRAAAATLTDSKGRFTFTVASPESRSLFAESPAQGSFGRLHTPPGDDLVLELQPGIHLHGTVRDEEGRSIPGALVKTLRLGGELSPQVSTVTDSAGRYRLGPLEPMEFVDMEAFAKAHPQSHGTPPRREVSVEAAHYLDDFKLHAGGTETAPIDFTLKRAATVEGIVVDTEGNPLRNVSVLLAVRIEGSEEPPYQHGEATVSDAAGRFSVDISREGEGWIDAESEDFTMDSVDISVPSQNVRLVLQRRPTLPGRVVDAAEKPLPGVSVYLYVEGVSSISGMESSDDEGRFVFKDLAPGRYTLKASIWVGGNGTERLLSQNVEVREGEASDAVVLRLEEGRALHGVVVDIEGRPLPDVKVLAKKLTEDPSDTESYEATYPTMGVRTNAEGRFVLRDLTDPRYALAVGSERYRLNPSRSRGGTLVGKAYYIERDGPELRLVMTRVPRVRGRLVQEDGAPLPDAEVGSRAMTAKDGSFDVARDEFDKGQLVIKHRNFMPLVRELDSSEGEQDLGTLTMRVGRTVRGILREPGTGKPYSGRVFTKDGPVGAIPLLVQVEQEDGRDIGARTGQVPVDMEADGTFVLEHLPSVPLVLKLVARPHYPPFRVRLDANQDSFDVTLVRGADVEVMIRDHQGQLVRAQVTLILQSVEAEGLESGFSTYSGKVQTNMLTPGPYIAKVRILDESNPGLEFAPTPLSIPASGTASFTLTPIRR
ncbi:carboxypeptidase-like regulatory domain-containing protein [Myxococcus stipitatus]|uniref:MSCRAMM family protein n=1 Tax=Myxococcus stipitatus TaxID=83455 RepID=UPI0030D0B610